MAETFAERLAQGKLATKAEIDDFIQNTDFDDKLKNWNKNVTSNKTKHVEAEKKQIRFTNIKLLKNKKNI